MTARHERLVVLYFALTLSALIVVKVFYYPDCFAFDSNDDANHTFVNLKAAQDTLRQGALPNLNLYNNFGTPLLGDALTYPFAVQAITYWFLPGYEAMTVNRFVIVFLTALVVCAFLRRYMSLVAALIFTLTLIYLTPSHFQILGIVSVLIWLFLFFSKFSRHPSMNLILSRRSLTQQTRV